MELKELEYVVAIAEQGSISKAAEKLYLAQSSLSQFLSRYETELGAKLFVRTSGGMRPTYAGDEFIRNAKQILQQYHRIKLELQEADRPKRGRIEFGISTFRGTSLLPSVMRQFHDEYPTVDIVIHEHDSVELLKKMAAGELDMALVAMLPGQEQPPNMHIMQDEVYLVAHREHPVMEYVRMGEGGPERPWVDLADAARFEFLLSDRTTVLGNAALQQFRQYGITPTVVNGRLTAYFAAEMAREGLGLAFTYRSCALPRENVVYLSIGKKRCFVDLVIIYPPDGYRSRASRAFEKIIQQYIKRSEIY